MASKRNMIVDPKRSSSSCPKMMRLEDEDSPGGDENPLLRNSMTSATSMISSASANLSSDSSSSSNSSGDLSSSSSSSDSEDNSDTNSCSRDESEAKDTDIHRSLDLDMIDTDMDFLGNVGDASCGPVDPVFVDQEDSSHAEANMDSYVEPNNIFENFSSDEGEHVEALNDISLVIEQHNGSSEPPPLPPLPPLPESYLDWKEENLPKSVHSGEARPNNSQNATVDQEEMSQPRVPEEAVPNGNMEPTENNGMEVDEDADYSDQELDDELHEMLEKEISQKEAENGEKEIVPKLVVTRYYLDKRGKYHIDGLPEGWIELSHLSGIPVYLHRPTRVITVTKPYFLGSGSSKRHSIPVEAIPCLNFSEFKSDSPSEENSGKSGDTSTSPPSGCPVNKNGKKLRFPRARVRIIGRTPNVPSVTPQKLTNYCQKRLCLKQVKIKKFSSWGEKRKFEKQTFKKHLQNMIESNKEADQTKDQTKDPQGTPELCKKATKRDHVPKQSLPNGTHLITIPVVELESTDTNNDDNALYQRVIKKSKKEWLLNPKGKSSVCILHEYVQHSMKKQPTYKFCEVDSSATPYSATVLINSLEYGTGLGSSKKLAKTEAARKTLEILIPELKDSPVCNDQNSAITEANLPDLSFFDNISVVDPKVNDLCNKASEPSPYAILVTCLQRNYGLGDTSIHTELRQTRFKRNEFYMRVSQKEVSVLCQNKRDGKQMAAQKLLQQLHPHVKNWGTLLRLYGSRAILSQKAKREKESEVTGLQSRNSSRPAPSLAILEKLKEEMKKLGEMKEAIAPLGKFVPVLNAQTPALANTCLGKVDL